MAVYTTLTKDDIKLFLAPLNVGALTSFEGILQGVENTNYRLETETGPYILTVFEARTDKNDLPFFFDFMNHLNANGIRCPSVIARGDIKEKAAALISFLDGHNIASDAITPPSCHEAGILLARMHKAALDFTQSRENSMAVSAWKNLFEKIGSLVDTIDSKLADIMSDEIARAEQTFSISLDQAVTHADFFPDNVFARDGRVDGVIDFYFSSTNALVYDLAIAFNAWCFDGGQFKQDRADAFLSGYQTIRVLPDNEKAAFQDMARAAALRILMTRSHDWVFHDPNVLVKPKNPLEYKSILDHHRSYNVLG